ncbi:MAG: DUF4180 domain-containing protein [Bacteroidetes bacterium]|nr:MAG: DUF4180 domain-containing protein [Bacteroidota bacterium]
MNIQIHEFAEGPIAELNSDQVLINTAEDGTDLVGNMYFQGLDKVILHQKNISPAFFELQNGLAGEVLQKFTNYRIRLVIVGQFTHLESRSLRDFILESNQGNQVNFVSSLQDAISRLRD